MNMTTSSTVSNFPTELDDWITHELIEWVRDVPLESDAVCNIPVILREYDRRKPLWQRIKCLFL